MSYRKIKINILGREHKIKCMESEEAVLLEIVRELNHNLEHFKKKYPRCDNESVLLLNTLNLMRRQQGARQKDRHAQQVLERVMASIEQSLAS